MWYFREGWNYLLELYFWIFLGAILLVSLTILFARPQSSNNNKYNYDNLEGQMGEIPIGNHSKSEVLDTNERHEQIEELEEEELTPEVIEQIERRKWALGFVMFGSAFIMVGAILLLISDIEFITFLGSCMIYIGIIALVKGASFEIQKDKTNNSYTSVTFFLVVFFSNFIMLTDLLEVIGNYAWAVKSTQRKMGDLLLVYLLPYIIWKIVPTFGASDGIRASNKLDLLNLKNMISVSVFNYILFYVTSTEFIFWPIMKQYSEPFIQVSLYLILVSICYELLLNNTNQESGINK